MRRALLALLLTAALTGCAPAVKVDNDKLDSDIDAQLGGLGVCVVLTDVKTGERVYQYGDVETCSRPLPPCDTFNIPNALIGLDSGVITPQTVFKWDGSPQPVSVWRTDADLTKANQLGIGWWYQSLARQTGAARFTQALKAFDYGSKTPAGPIDGFWRGPQAGGGLGVSTRQQADFLRKFYTGALPVKPATTAVVQKLTLDETRTDAKGIQFIMSDQTGACASQPDGSRSVGWFTGRLQTPTHDLAFAASIEGAQAPPGLEIERHLKDVFSDAGLWPAGE